ncbi:MAG: Gfo/Idh/MocA family oxidoreductase [Candidatus Sungbacteria bacterium]|nr:Gfo/Idh/MocA family oxidoreductase [bacterium]MDZ4260339.1 Gfo/Idh/MocA family oxidoreductase [Candidatus Sungbacteria bacterium]
MDFLHGLGEGQQMKKWMKVGIVGYGQMGKMWAEVLSAMPGVELAAIAEPDQARRSEAFLMRRCSVFADVFQMFGISAGLDAVVIATHVTSHFNHVMHAFERGCHVICEKPMALTLRQCDMMVSEAKRRGLKLAINHQSIFSRAAQTAQKKIMAGDIGKLYAIKAYGKGRIACSDLMEIAGHLLHMMSFFAGYTVTEVYGDAIVDGRPVTLDDVKPILELYPQGRDSGLGAGDRLFGYYKFSNGIRGELHLDMLEGAPDTFGEKLGQSRNYGYNLELMGTKGRMQLYLPRFLFFNSSPLDDFSKNNTPWPEVDPALREDRDPILMRILTEQFFEAIEKDWELAVSGEIGRMVMDMTHGVYASHLAGRPLPLPLADRRHPFCNSRFYKE